MRRWRRLRAYPAWWTLVGLVTAGLVFVVASAGPVTRHLADNALRQLVDQAPASTRDLTFSEPRRLGSTAAGVRDEVTALLSPDLADRLSNAWGIQRTRILGPSHADPEAAPFVTLAGAGVSAKPSGFLPLVTFHHQTDLLDEVDVVAGEPPSTDATDPTSAVVEVMAAAPVAETLGLQVGEVYSLLPGQAEVRPEQVTGDVGPAVAVRLTGLFAPQDPAAAIWELDRRLLAAPTRLWPPGAQPPQEPVPIRQATLVTDQSGINVLTGQELGDFFAGETVVRLRLDTARLDADWAAQAPDAVADLLGNTGLRTELRVETALFELIDEFQGQLAAGQAVAAVVTAGLVGVGAGLLALVAATAGNRRREELALLRARGGSWPTLLHWCLAEAALVVLPAAALGWLLHLPVPGRSDPALVPGLGAAPVTVAAGALLLVAVVLALGGRARPVAAQRSELVHYPPVRITIEVAVVLLAGVGVLVLHQRGLTRVGGADPYLAMVPVLIGAAAGLLALRLHPWPLRLLGLLTARRPGVVAFLGLARASRAAPVTALPMVVLVLAVAVGGFSGAVYQAIDAGRQAVAVQAVGAHARVAADGLAPGTVTAVATLPGVTTVAAMGRGGFLLRNDRVVQGSTVVIVDTPAYQQILTAIDAPGRLPQPLLAADATTDPVPVLVPPHADSGQELAVQLPDGQKRPVTVVGEISGLPDLAPGDNWVLLPRHAAPTTPIDELLIAGADADLAAVREAVADATGNAPEHVEVTSLAGYREELAGSEFQPWLSLMFLIGTIGAAVGGVLAVELTLVGQAAARGRTLALLRTMGLSHRQTRALLLIELLPVLAVAVAVGAVVGVGMPVLLAPALGLTELTGGAPVVVTFDLGTVALLTGLLGVFLVGAVLAEAAAHRRLGLGRVLRFDS